MHLCALLDQQAIAQALVGEASADVPFLFVGEKRPPQFKASKSSLKCHNVI